MVVVVDQPRVVEKSCFSQPQICCCYALLYNSFSLISLNASPCRVNPEDDGWIPQYDALDINIEDFVQMGRLIPGSIGLGQRS